MSMFLGPIHYVMFNKIKIAAGRAAAVISLFEEKHPEQTREAVQAALPDGVVDFGGRSLEEILGDNPIHQFLQSLIDRIEQSEATLVTALLYSFPDDGKALLMEAFRAHGARTAKTSIDGDEQARGADLIEKTLSLNYLEGMPCDPGGSYMKNGNSAIEVTHSDCLHMRKWESVGAPVETMCELLDAWVEGFIDAVSTGAKLERTQAIAKGASGCSCRLTLNL